MDLAFAADLPADCAAAFSLLLALAPEGLLTRGAYC
jgi:hypothetical protein